MDVLFQKIRIEAQNGAPACTLNLDQNKSTYTIILDHNNIAGKELKPLYENVSRVLKDLDKKFNLDLTLYNLNVE